MLAACCGASAALCVDPPQAVHLRPVVEKEKNWIAGEKRSFSSSMAAHVFSGSLSGSEIIRRQHFSLGFFPSRCILFVYLSSWRGEFWQVPTWPVLFSSADPKTPLQGLAFSLVSDVGHPVVRYSPPKSRYRLARSRNRTLNDPF